ncbi:hypothetical protein [Citrobacter telavivensis]
MRKVSSLASKDTSKKWSMPIQKGWRVMSHLIIEHGDRLGDLF